MIKLLILILTCAWALACGAPDTTEIGTAQDELSRESGFGVRSSNGFQCYLNTADHCYYPPYDNIKLHIRTTGLTINQHIRMGAAAAAIKSELENNPGGVWVSPFVLNISINSDSCGVAVDPAQTNICVTKDVVGAPGSANIQGYAGSYCGNPGPNLPEFPSLTGTHSYCYHRIGSVDLNDIDTNWVGQEQAVTTHALAAIVLAGEGIGLRDSGETNVWSHQKVSPATKLGATENELCRQVFSDQGSGPGGFNSVSNEFGGSWCN